MKMKEEFNLLVMWAVSSPTSNLSTATVESLLAMDQYQYLGNCAPTPPLTQHVILL